MCFTSGCPAKSLFCVVMCSGHGQYQIDYGKENYPILRYIWSNCWHNLSKSFPWMASQHVNFAFVLEQLISHNENLLTWASLTTFSRIDCSHRIRKWSTLPHLKEENCKHWLAQLLNEFETWEYRTLIRRKLLKR